MWAFVSLYPLFAADVYLAGSVLVEGAGFEPAQPFQAADLQSAPINHSGTPPPPLLTTIPAREGIRTR